MNQIAQTNIQLFNQMRQQGRNLDESARIHHVYQITAQLYSGYYQADGEPFTSHCIGVASIVALLCLPIEFIALGLLHNIYASADFGDGLDYGATMERCSFIQNAIDPELKALIFCFYESRVTPVTIKDISGRLELMNTTEINLVLVDIADYLEKYIDLGVLYYGDNDWLIDDVAQTGDDLVELARRLNKPELAEWLSKVFKQVAETDIPEILHAPDRQKYLQLTVPYSCQRK